MSQMGCTEVVHFYTFHKVETGLRLVEWELATSQPVAKEASKNKLITIIQCFVQQKKHI